MKIKNLGIWNKARENNKDPYGKCVLDYAEAWADTMELEIESGAKLENIADRISHEVDNRPGFGITGFMYGAAVSTLSQVWEYGEQLRIWHNSNMQIRN